MRKVIALLVICSLILSSFGIAFAANQSDYAGHWAEGQIQAWVDQGLISGYEDGSIKPDNSITRAEFFTLVNRALKYTDTSAVDYRDVPGDAWYAGEIGVALAAGYITGYEDGTIRPDNPISRQEVAAVLVKINNLQEKATEADKFSDAAVIPSWSKGLIGAVSSAGLMGGYPDGKFQPIKEITRAETIVALGRVLASIGSTGLELRESKLIYDRAGIYGGATGVETLKGNVIVSAANVALRNLIIEGNLTITEAVGNGNVSLINVTVTGTTYVYGGGENSIIVDNSNLDKVMVNKDDGKIRIVTSGTTSIREVTAASGVKLEERNLVGSGFKGVIVTAPKEARIDLVGTFEVVQVKSKEVTVNVPGGSTVKTLVLDEAAKVTGQGTIEAAEVNAEGVSFEKRPEKLEVKAGVIAPSVPSVPSSGGSSGSSGPSTPTVEAVTLDGAQDPFISGSTHNNKDFTITGLTANGYYGPETGTAIINGDVTLKAEGATLRNLVVNGTLYLDPGEDGDATLDGVTANNIVVLSGGENSIHFISVTVTVELTVAAEGQANPVRIVTTGTTSVAQTRVDSNVRLDQTAGSLGKIDIRKTVDVQLEGNITQTITVSSTASGARLRSEQAGTSFANVVTNTAVSINSAGSVGNVRVATTSQVVIEGSGSYGDIDVEEDAPVVIKNTTVTNINVNSKADVSVSSGTVASINLNADDADVDIGTGTTVAQVSVSVTVTTTVRIENSGTITTIVTEAVINIEIGGNTAENVDEKANVTIKPRRPAADPSTGSVVTFPTSLTLTAETGADIYYTVGTAANPPVDPTTESGILYNSANKPVIATGQTFVRAIAVKDGESSNILELKYTQAKVAINSFTAKTMVMGTTIELNAIANPEAAQISVNSSNSNFVAVSMVGSKIIITGNFPGTATITVNATKTGYLDADARTFTVTVTAPPLVISAVNPKAGYLETPYSHTFTVTGGVSPSSFILSGILPPGLNLASNGKLTGTPIQAGTFSFSVWVTDSLGTTDGRQYSITIADAPVAPAANVTIRTRELGPLEVIKVAVNSVARVAGATHYRFNNLALTEIGEELLFSAANLGGSTGMIKIFDAEAELVASMEVVVPVAGAANDLSGQEFELTIYALATITLEVRELGPAETLRVTVHGVSQQTGAVQFTVEGNTTKTAFGAGAMVASESFTGTQKWITIYDSAGEVLATLQVSAPAAGSANDIIEQDYQLTI